MILASFDIGIVNMAYCILDGERIVKWEIISLCNGTEIQNTVDLVKKLDERPEILDADVILLERQLSINPKMRVMAEAVRGYLIIRGLVDKTKAFKMINYSSKHKLNCYNGAMPSNLIPDEDHLMDTTVSGKSKMYRFRKKQSVYHCEKLIEKQDQWARDLFKGSKKKDDLADAYLQGLSYIMYEDNKANATPNAKANATPNANSSKDANPNADVAIIKRRPTKKQTKYNKYSKNNLKWLFAKHLGDSHEVFTEGHLEDISNESNESNESKDPSNDISKDLSKDKKLRDWSKTKAIHKSVLALYGLDSFDALKRDMFS